MAKAQWTFPSWNLGHFLVCFGLLKIIWNISLLSLACLLHGNRSHTRQSKPLELSIQGIKHHGDSYKALWDDEWRGQRQDAGSRRGHPGACLAHVHHPANAAAPWQPGTSAYRVFSEAKWLHMKCVERRHHVAIQRTSPRTRARIYIPAPRRTRHVTSGRFLTSVSASSNVKWG